MFFKQNWNEYETVHTDTDFEAFSTYDTIQVLIERNFYNINGDDENEEVFVVGWSVVIAEYLL